GSVLAGLLAAACVSETIEPPRLTTEVTTATEDPTGRPTDGQGLAARVWGPDDPSAPAPDLGASGTNAGAGGAPPAAKDEAIRELDFQDPTQDDEAERRQRDAELRNQFGSAVVIAPDGTVTKQYFLSGETATVFESLLREPGVPTPPEAVATGYDLDGSSQSVLGRMLGPHRVRLTLFKNFEQ